jgi:hypothetical protein
MLSKSVKTLLSNRDSLIYLLNAFVITQFLFFIDEGYYDFRWMSSLGNWIVFFIYLLAILLFEILIHFLLVRTLGSPVSRVLSALLGSITALFVLIFFVF